MSLLLCSRLITAAGMLTRGARMASRPCEISSSSIKERHHVAPVGDTLLVKVVGLLVGLAVVEAALRQRHAGFVAVVVVAARGVR